MSPWPFGGPKKIRCPHCGKELHPSEVEWRDKDGEYHPAKRSGLWGWGPPDFQGPKWPSCPECNNTLPRSALSGDNMMIGMVGAPASGKSHYIAALVDRLRSGLGDFHTTVPALDPDTQQRYKTQFEEPLLKFGEPLQKTAGGNPPPLLFDFAVGGGNKRKRSAMLCLYDGVGDPHQDMESMLVESPYIGSADGLIVIIDPLQIDTVQKHVGDKIVSTSSAVVDSTANDLIDSIRYVMEMNDRIAPNGKADVSLAVAFSKCDVLCRADLLNERQKSAWQGSALRHDGVFDCRVHDRLSSIFEARLEEWAEGAHELITQRFPNHGFFGVTATGSAPVKETDENGEEIERYESVRPWRVEEPLLWLAWKFGLIEGTERP